MLRKSLNQPVLIVATYGFGHCSILTNFAVSVLLGNKTLRKDISRKCSPRTLANGGQYLNDDIPKCIAKRDISLGKVNCLPMHLRACNSRN